MKKITMLLFFVMGFSVLAQPLTVAPLPSLPEPQTADDIQMTNRVREQLRARIASFPLEKFGVVSQDGQVTIQGRVHTQDEADEIISAARKTPGLTSVNNAILVNPVF